MKKIICLGLISLALCIGLPQSSFAQDAIKIKKVNYLGHKYNGQINKKKVPTGRGVLTIGDLTIKGTFNGNVVTDAIVDVECKEIKGAIMFDESDYFTIKSGSIIKVNYAREKDHTFIDDSIELPVNRDSIIDPYTFLRSQAIPIPILKDVPKELNPPQNFGSYELQHTEEEYTTMEQASLGRQFLNAVKSRASIWENNNSNMIEVKHTRHEFISRENDWIKVSSEVKNLKDSEGRIWNYERLKDKVYYDVTYPNGSFYQYTPDGSIGCVVYSDGSKMKFYHGQVGFGKDYTVKGEFDELKLFLENVNQKAIVPITGKLLPHNQLLYVSSDKYNFEDMQSKDVESFISDEIVPLFNLSSLHLKFEGKDEKECGEFQKGQYLSNKEKEAIAKAENEKRDKKIAEAEAWLESQYKRFTSRFGFDPRQQGIFALVKAGRSYDLVLDYLSFIHDLQYNANYVSERNKDLLVTRFYLKTDMGKSKNIQIVYMGNRTLGTFWTNGDKITSVTWY